MTLQESPFDLKALFQLAIVFVFLGFPVLRGILRSRQERLDKQQREGRGNRRPPAGGTGQGPRPERPPLSLEDLFPELGEEEPLPPPIPKPVRPPAPAPAPAPARAPEPAPAPFRDPLVERPAEPRRLGSRIPEPKPRSQLRTEFGVTFEALDDDRNLTTRDDNLRPIRRRRRRAPRAVDWRRAVVLAEVLGTPVSLRKGGSWPGAPRGL